MYGKTPFHLILIVLALVMFLISSFSGPYAGVGVAAGPWYSRWNYVAFGLFCLTLSLLV